jgi:hypothetical protein
MDLSLRPTLNAGDETDDYCVIQDGRSVGRIRLAGERSRQGVAAWEWRINPPLPIPPWCNGTAASLEAAKDAFRAAWERFYASLTPERIRRWPSNEWWLE